MIFSQYPSHWIEAKIGYKYSVQLGKMLQPEPRDENDILRPYLRAANIFWDKIDLSDVNEMYFSPKEIDKFSLRKSDLLVSEGGDVGRSCIWNNRAVMYFQNALNRIRERKKSDCTTQFLYYWLYHLKSCGYISMLCNVATISHYTAEKLKATFFVFPPLEEQKSIVKFLDYKTEQIDKLIEKKEKLLKLLEEKRIALITNAVTGHCHSEPDLSGEESPTPSLSQMKSSGVEWLGNIPQHWEVKRLKFAVKLVNEKIDTEEVELLYMGLENIESWTGKKNETTDYLPEGVANKFIKDDVLFGKLRPYLAKVFLTKEDGCCTTEALVLRSKSQVVPKFLSYYLLSNMFIEVVNSSTFGSKMPRASWEFIGSLAFLLPPLKEQESIVEYLDIELTKTDQLSEQVNKAIEKLKEYRTSLIASAVTGKIDLRNWQPPQISLSLLRRWTQGEACTEQSRSVEEVN